MVVDLATSGGMLAFVMAFFAFVMVIGTILWIYTSLAFMAIGKKAKDDLPGLAWIPSIGPALIAFRASGMHWWPWLLIIGMFIPFVGFIFAIAFAVFGVIWQWKMFEKIKRPGYWAILCLIPILNLVLYGIAAWSKD